MLATRVPYRFGFRTIPALRALLLILAVITVAGIATSPSLLLASPITYEFSNASMVLSGSTYQITGSFVVDPDTGDQTFVDITLTGAAPVGTNTYIDNTTYQLGLIVPQSVMDIPPPLAGMYSGVVISVEFASLLDQASDNLSSVSVTGIWSTPTGGDTIMATDTSPTGAAVPAPEPASLALLSVALGLFVLVTNTHRRVG